MFKLDNEAVIAAIKKTYYELHEKQKHLYVVFQRPQDRDSFSAYLESNLELNFGITRQPGRNTFGIGEICVSIEASINEMNVFKVYTEDYFVKHHKSFLTPPKEDYKEEVAAGIGTKDDRQKIRLSLFPTRAFVLINEVFNFGSKKYSDYNWKKLEKKRLWEAMQRHIMALQMGEIHDAETGLPHIAHIATNAAMLTELHLERPSEHVTDEPHNSSMRIDIIGVTPYAQLVPKLYPESIENELRREQTQNTSGTGHS